jgi:tripartite-type tricarboxylate transporter receptor subunit TctC
LLDVVGGSADLMFDSMMTALPLAKAGKLRALAVTGAQRSPVVPELPTIAEAGLKGYSAYGWIGIVAPAGTPKPIVDKLYDAIAKALQDPDVRKKLVAQAAEPVASTPEQFAKFIQEETDKWALAVRGAKLSIE